jgi:periplasmic copper chaperone A
MDNVSGEIAWCTMKPSVSAHSRGAVTANAGRLRRAAALALAATLTSLCGAVLLLTSPPARSAAAAAGSATQAEAVQIKSAWIRWLPGGVPLAGYATLANVSDQPLVLTSAASAAFQDISLHQTLQTGGSVRMSPLERISIAPHTTLDFESRGIHLMLMQPRGTLDPHDQIPITLHFADGSSVTIQFQVRSSAGDTSRG